MESTLHHTMKDMSDCECFSGFSKGIRQYCKNGKILCVQLAWKGSETTDKRIKARSCTTEITKKK